MQVMCNMILKNAFIMLRHRLFNSSLLEIIKIFFIFINNIGEPFIFCLELSTQFCHGFSFFSQILYPQIKMGDRVRNLKFATYLKFATCENTNKINELW